jgi:hypothetical protein
VPADASTAAKFAERDSLRPGIGHKERWQIPVAEKWTRSTDGCRRIRVITTFAQIRWPRNRIQRAA